MSNTAPAKGMGRKPAHIGHYGTQDAIWKAVRELSTFTGNDLICHLDKALTVNDGTVKSYLKRLVKGGYLQAQPTDNRRGARQEYRYTLVKNTGVETPKLTRDGKPTVQGKGREQMWRAMKILRDFTYAELAMNASTPTCLVKPSTAKDYIKILFAAGYVVAVRPGKAKTPGRYKLLDSKYTGPRPPQIQKTKSLFDPNLDRVVWSNGGDQ